MSARARRLLWTAALVLILLALGGSFAWRVARWADSRLRDDLLQHARLIAPLLPADRLAALTGTDADLASPDYLAVKELLARARAANEKCRFLYLMGRRPDGAIFFYADSEPPESPDSSPAGQLYTEAPATCRRVFDTERPAVEGPYADRWGRWVTALVPLRSPALGDRLTVLGMDVDAGAWTREVAAHAALPVGLMTATLILAAGLFLAVARRGELRTSEQRFRRLFDDSFEGIYQTTVDGHCRTVNPAFARMFGHDSPADLIAAVNDIGQQLYVDPEDRRRLLAAMEASGGAVQGYEVRMRRRDGSSFWVSINARVLYPDRLTPVIEGSCVDISERRKVEEERAQQMELIARLSATPDVRGALEICLDAAIRVSGMDSGGAYLLERETGALVLVTHRGLSPDFVGRVARVAPGSPNYDLVLAGQALFVRHRDLSPEDQRRHEGLRALAVVPVLHNGQVIACINLASHMIDAVSEATQALLKAFVAQTGSFIARAQADSALLESQERLADIIEFLPDATFAVDNQRRVIFWNRAIEEMTGLSAAEMVGQGDHAYTVPFYGERRPCLLDLLDADRDEVAAKYPDLRREGASITAEVFCHALYGGRGAWVFAKVSPLHDREGRVIGAIESIRDITARRQAQEDLRQKSEELDAFFSTGLDLFCIADVDGFFRRLNPQWESTLGFSLEELEGRRFLDFVHPDDVAATLGALTRLGRQEKIINFVNRYRCQNGEYRWIEWRSTPGGRLIFAAARDITAKRQTEEALRESEARLRRTFDQSPIGAAIVGLDFRFLRANKEFCRFLGYTAEELCALTFRDITYPDQVEDDVKNVGLLTAGEIEQYNVTKRYLRKDGRVVWGQLSLRLQRDADGKALSFLPMVVDVTASKETEQERAALQDQLQQAMKMEAVGRLAGGVAHDFNNQLTAILGNVSMAMLDLPDGDPLRETLTEVSRAAKSAADLTRQLLAFSRKQLVEPRVLDLNEIIGRLQKMLGRLIGEDIALTLSLADGLGPVLADPTQVEQILVNLVVNARDALPDGGSIELETADATLDEDYCRRRPHVRPGDYVMLSVADNGVGMSEEVKARIFEPFFTTKELGKGTGLGLSTVYGAVTQNGGHIDLRSAPGQGATFAVYLPRAAASPDRREWTDREELPRGTEAVALVEDERAVRGLATRVLRRQGYRVVAYANAQEALVGMRQLTAPLHLLLTDVVMPGISGKALAEQVRALRPDIKVLFTSGYTADAIAHHGVLDAGIEFIGKPYTPLALARKVREVLDKANRPGGAA